MWLLGKNNRAFALTSLLNLFISAMVLAQDLTPSDVIREKVSLLRSEQQWEELEVYCQDRLADYYATRIGNRVIPTDLIDTAIRKAQKKDKQAIIRNPPPVIANQYILEDNPDIAFLHLNLAFAKMNLKHYQHAIANFREAKRYLVIAAEKQNEYAFIDYQISQCYKALNNRNGVIANLETALNLDPNNAEYRQQLGLEYQNIDNNKAIHHLEQYLQIQNPDRNAPEDSHIYLIMAGLYQQKNRYMDTLRYYDAYLRHNASNGDIQYAAGVIAAKHTGHYQRALGYFQAALKNLNQNAFLKKFHSHQHTGDIFYKVKEYDKAIRHYEAMRPYYQNIASTINEAEQRLAKIQQRIDQTKLEIMRENNQESQERLESLLILLEEEKRRSHKAFLLKNAYNFGSVEWKIAEIYEIQGLHNKSIGHYESAMRLHYRSTDAYLKIQELKTRN